MAVSRIGAVLSLIGIASGLFVLITGSIVASVWWAMLGLFLRRAAKLPYEQLVMRPALESEPVRRFLNPGTITVSPALTVQKFLDECVDRYHHKLYPVVESTLLLGCLCLEQIKPIPKPDWSNPTLKGLVDARPKQSTVAADADAVRAHAKISRSHASRLIAGDGKGHLAGVLALKDLPKFLSLRVELQMG